MKSPRAVSTGWRNSWLRREYVGYDVPLSSDHFGRLGVNSCIRLGKALEKYDFASLEDMIPWQYPDLLKQIKQQVNIPLNTGEDIYLKENFIKLASMHATDILHPDLATSGGSLADGLPNPIVQKGFIDVPEKPGLGLAAQRRRGETASGAGDAVLRAHRSMESGSFERIACGAYRRAIRSAGLSAARADVR